MKNLIYLYVIVCVTIFVSILFAMAIANWLDRKLNKRRIKMENSETAKIYISKADPITRKEPISDAEIHIKKKMPVFSTLVQAEEYYKNDALDIFDILKNHLPQATRHQLLLLLLNDTENLYRGI